MTDEADALLYAGPEPSPPLAPVRLPLTTGTPIPKGIYIVPQKLLSALQAREDFVQSDSDPNSGASLSARTLGNSAANHHPTQHVSLEKDYQVSTGSIPNALIDSLQQTWQQLEGSSQKGSWNSQRANEWRNHPKHPPVIVVGVRATTFERLQRTVIAGTRAELVADVMPPDDVLARVREYFWGKSYAVDDIRVRMCRAARSPQERRQAEFEHWLESRRGQAPPTPWFPPVLIQGPAGTGKQMVAEGIHRLSYDSGLERCVVLDCQQEERNLYLALFGASRASGAPDDIEHGALYHYRTVILDRVGRMPPAIQRALDEALALASPPDGTTAQVLPAGSAHRLPVAGRIIALSGVDLRDLAARDEFRSSLYYKLSTFLIHVPRLDDHRQDVGELARLFWRRLHLDNSTASLTQEATMELQSRPWPGNGRELEHVLQSCAERFPSCWRLGALEVRNVLEDRYHEPLGSAAGISTTVRTLRRSIDLIERTLSDLRALENSSARSWAAQSLLERQRDLYELAMDPDAFDDENLRGAAYDAYATLKRISDEIASGPESALPKLAAAIANLTGTANKMRGELPEQMR